MVCGLPDHNVLSISIFTCRENAVLQFTEDFNGPPVGERETGKGYRKCVTNRLFRPKTRNVPSLVWRPIDSASDVWRMVKRQAHRITMETPGSFRWHCREQTSAPGYLRKELQGSQLKNPGAIGADKTPEFYDSIKISCVPTCWFWLVAKGISRG